MKEPGCPSCEALSGNQNCGGHWSKTVRPRWYGNRETAVRGKPDLDKQEGNDTR